MPKIYTKTGDAGETSLIGGRLKKDNLRTETYGTCDELASHIGHLHSFMQSQKNVDIYLNQLEVIMQTLFDLGSDLATIADANLESSYLDAGAVTQLEKWIDEMNQHLPELSGFILPSGAVCATQAHIARTVCRRLERLMVTLFHEQTLAASNLIYVNRLSDYLFTLARLLNVLTNSKEIEKK